MASEGTRTVALYGGTFDPFHAGHLRMAIEVRERIGTDRLLVIPAAAPPHKPGQPVTPAAHRLAMASLAVAGIPGIEVSDIEIRRKGPSYTLTTVREVRAEEPESAILLLLGADQFSEISTWWRSDELQAEADIVLLPRPGHPGPPPGLHRVDAADDGCYRLDVETFLLPSGRLLHALSVPMLDISSRLIREKVREMKSVRGLVAPEVERYIADNALYHAHP